MTTDHVRHTRSGPRNSFSVCICRGLLCRASLSNALPPKLLDLRTAETARCMYSLSAFGCDSGAILRGITGCPSGFYVVRSEQNRQNRQSHVDLFSCQVKCRKRLKIILIVKNGIHLCHDHFVVVVDVMLLVGGFFVVQDTNQIMVEKEANLASINV